MNKNTGRECEESKFPLTDIQMAYLLGRNPKLYLGGNSTHFYVELITKLNPIRLEKALNKVIKEQPMLRAIILPEGMQQILKEVPEYKLKVENIKDKIEEEQKEIILKQRAETSHRQFKTDQWPLFSFFMYQTSQEEYRLIVDFDMMIVDGFSTEILVNEILAHYEDENREAMQINYTFKEYVYEHLRLVEEQREEDEAFWKEQIKSMPLGPELPVYVEEGKIHRFNQKEFVIADKEWSGLKKRLAKTRIIPAMYLLTSFSKTLSKFCNQTDFAVNLTLTRRRGKNTAANVIGDFTENLPIDMHFEKGSDFLQIAKATQKRLAYYRKHNTVGGIYVMKKVAEYNGLSNGVPFPVVFTSMLFDTAESSWDKAGERVYQISQTPQVLLDCNVMERKGSLILRWDYLEDCFDPEFINQMFDFFVKEIWQEIEGNPVAVDSNEAWITYNQTTDYIIRETTLQELFSEQTKKSMDQVALICEDQSMTYEELDWKSTLVCNAIIEEYGTGQAIVLEAHRSINTVVWMLGILKSGGYYIPVEPKWPKNRKQYILENSKAATMIDVSQEAIPEEVINVECDRTVWRTDALAYIIYTSGSTGTPKGVAITQSAVCNTIQDINNRFHIGEDDVILGISSYCFDLSVYDVFGTLASGATCVIMKDRTDIEEYNEILKKYPISVWNSVPAILEMLIDNSRFSCDSMKTIMLSGDWIPLDLPQKAKNCFKQAEIYSLGGATEASIWSIYFLIQRVDFSWKSIPYGYPLANQNIYVLDYEDCLCPWDVDGEICIGGKGVAKEYLNDEKKTREHFFVHPELGRLYRTGDYGCFSREGYVIFKGRKDAQVKLHGYRVELGEIENKMKQFKGINEAAVIVDNKEQSQHLLGYVIPKKCKTDIIAESFENAARGAKEAGYCYPEEISLMQYSSILDQLDEAAVGIMLESLKKTGAIGQDGTVLDIEEITRRHLVSYKYEKVLEQWFEVLRSKNVIRINEDEKMMLVSENADIDVDHILEHVLSLPEAQHWKDFFEFVVLCREKMMEILSEEVNPVVILFQDGDWSRAENYYRKNPIAEYYNQIVAKAIGAYVKSHSGCTKILEVGAGTGGTSYDIFREICNMNVEYTYTDLSTFFTQEAKERFKEYDFIRYGLYAIDTEPQAQAYEEGSYQIVIGANVLHDALNITNALKNLSKLLTNDGMLVLLETTTNRLIQKVSVGLIEGFSNYSDERMEKKQPLQTNEEWIRSFEKSGYKKTLIYPVGADENKYFEQSIFLSVPQKKYVDIAMNQLKQYLHNELPSYMVPEGIYVIDEIPLSSNGKVKKELLPKYNLLKQKNEEIEIVPPANQTEQQLFDILSEALHESFISVHTNLFELGIDSLKAITVVTKCKEQGFNITMVDLYSYPSIRELSEFIQQNFIVDDDSNTYINYKQFAVEPHYNYERYELNEIQKAYLYGRNPAFELGNISTHYYAEIASKLDMTLLEKSLNQVINNQQVLRTVIYEDGTQQILKETKWYQIQIIDLCGHKKDEQERIQADLREHMSHQMHEIGAWPMFEFKAIKTDENQFILYFSLDVMLSDGASILLLWNEIAACYNGKEQVKLDFSFSDYQESVRELENSDVYRQDEAYWVEKAENFPDCAPLPYKTSFANIKKPHFSRLQYVLSRNDWQNFKAIAKEKHLTPAALLCSVYSTVLSRYSNSSHFGINMTVFNRYPFYEKVNEMIGDFTSTCILDIETQLDFWQQSEEIQKTIFKGMGHRHYDGIKFLKQLTKKSGNPLSAIMPVIFTCALFDADTSQMGTLGDIRYILSQTSQAALDNQTTCLNGELHIAWDYVEQIFDEDLIQEMFKGYIELIQKISRSENIILLDEKALEEKISLYNQTEKPYKPVTLDYLFKQQVKKTPLKTAVVCGENCVNYEELNALANQVANYLCVHKYIGYGVAVLDEKSIETVAAILGILKAGCYYVPISPDYPKSRREYIMTSSDCKLLLTVEFMKEFVFIAGENTFEDREHSPENCAYIIYTSGSTGNPKGVMISHSAVCNTILDINNRYKVGTNDEIIGLSAFNFDLSVYDLFGTLSCGAALVLVKEYRDVHEVKKVLLKHQITFWNSVPALVQMIINSLEENEKINSVKHILMSGDWIPVNLIEKIRNSFPNADITSLGGATEASIWSIYYPVQDVNKDWRSIPYGHPLDNQKMYVLNQAGDYCPVGVKGEIYIGGIGVAMGYMKNEEGTKEHFIKHTKLGYIYRTGDYGIFHKEGYIEFLGRVDDQVKMHGYRIELDEISNTLKKHELVEAALSIITEGESRSILAYIVPKKKIEASALPMCDSWEVVKNTAYREVECTPSEMTAARYNEWNQILEDKSLFIMLRTIGTLYESAFRKPLEHSVIDILELGVKSGIRELYTKAICQWFLEFVRLGYATQLKKNVFQMAGRDKLDEIQDILLNDYIKETEKVFFEESLHFFELCNANLIDLLTGKETILNLLFPEGKWDVAENLYQTNPVAEYYNRIVSEIIHSYIKGKRDIRILETGAGIGGTTAAVLRQLRNEDIKYTYTDLSTFFTEKAKMVYTEYEDKIQYDLFNINLTPQEQGFGLEQYDVILAANMLHDAKDLHYTLKNLKNMLKPNGILVVLEQNRNTRLQMVTTAMIDGFSDYSDFRLEQNAPLLSPMQWMNLLKEDEFCEAVSFPTVGSEAELYGQSVIIGRKLNQKEFLTEDELSSVVNHANQYLAKYMVPSRLIQLDAFPLSANGKVSKKLLPVPKTVNKMFQGEKPVTETEKILFKKWVNVLGTEDFGVNDDFYSAGGDSLKAIQLISDLNADKDVDIRRFMDGTSIHEIAAYLDEERIHIN